MSDPQNPQNPGNCAPQVPYCGSYDGNEREFLDTIMCPGSLVSQVLPCQQVGGLGGLFGQAIDWRRRVASRVLLLQARPYATLQRAAHSISLTSAPVLGLIGLHDSCFRLNNASTPYTYAYGLLLTAGVR